MVLARPDYTEPHGQARAVGSEAIDISLTQCNVEQS